MDFYDTQIPCKVDAPPQQPKDAADTDAGALLALFYVCGFWFLLGLALWAACQ